MYKWETLVKYPQCIKTETKNILNSIEDLIGVTFDHFDRYVNMSNFLENAVKAGLITKYERFDLEFAIANNM